MGVSRVAPPSDGREIGGRTKRAHSAVEKRVRRGKKPSKKCST